MEINEGGVVTVGAAVGLRLPHVEDDWLAARWVCCKFSRLIACVIPNPTASIPRLSFVPP